MSSFCEYGLCTPRAQQSCRWPRADERTTVVFGSGPRGAAWGGGSEREGGKVSVRSKNEMTCKIPTRGRDRGSQSIRREVHAPPILLIAVTTRDREVLSLWLRTKMPITVPDYPRIHKHCPCPTIKKNPPVFSTRRIMCENRWFSAGTVLNCFVLRPCNSVQWIAFRLLFIRRPPTMIMSRWCQVCRSLWTIQLEVLSFQTCSYAIILFKCTWSPLVVNNK